MYLNFKVYLLLPPTLLVHYYIQKKKMYYTFLSDNKSYYGVKVHLFRLNII